MTSRVRPQKLAHVVYRTRRFPEMLEWYKTVFAARVIMQNPALAFLTYDDEHHRFLIADLEVIKPDDEEPEKPGLVGVDHVAYTYASLEDLLNNYRYLKQEGILPYWCIHHGVTASMYYADPDGNQMEFQVDAFDDKSLGGAYIAGEAMEANPIGVEYDPEAWLGQIEAGTPAAELLAQQPEGEASPIRGALG